MNATHRLEDVRPSPIAGRWYPADPLRLARSIDDYLDRANVPAVAGRLIGVLAPHAGHRYSGPVAGYAFKAVRGLNVDVVALVGPSHYPYEAALVATAHDAYETPLGLVPVDRPALDALQRILPLRLVRTDPEHSLEIELPFLQRTLGAFRLIPLALVNQSYELAQQVGYALADLLAGQNALLVASSDLSHFYPQDIARRFDQTMLDAVARFDPAAVIAAEEKGVGFACGRGAIATVMIAARQLGADTAQVVGYATSGDITGDTSQVVGYGAALFYQRAAGQADA
ncbi:MAG: AmmeMemoRadiSam system protein B [Anaerolineae bacterium]